MIKPMSDADELVKRLRYRSSHAGMNHTADQRLLIEAADMIEQMAERIEADDAAYKELERRHAD